MSKHRILIVEDNPDLRMLVRITFETECSAAYDIEETENGLDALKSIENRKPDLVLLDVMMPGLVDGLEVCTRIKSRPGWQSIKVILLTARGQQTDIEKGLAAGADAYLVKPFSPLNLLETAERLLEEKTQMEHEARQTDAKQQER